MEINEIMKLIQAVSDYGLTSFELEEGNIKIALKREKETVIIGGTANPEPVSLASGILQNEVQKTAARSSGEDISTQNEISSDNVVNSPLVGTFYSAPSPDSEDFVKVGDHVKKGQVLGIIEAMKLMNEIESDFDGVVEAILVKNEDVVEYGQPLFRIR